MPRPTKGRVDHLAPDRISTDLMLDELKSKIQLAEYEHKATFEKCEQEKKGNFSALVNERRKNKIRRSSMFSNCTQSSINIPDYHNITYAFENKMPSEKIYLKKKQMTTAVVVQDGKVCEAIKRYNLRVHEREQKEEQVRKLREELDLLKKWDQKRRQNELSSPEAQKMRLLENNIEKLKMKLSSAQLISRKYNKIIDNLKEDTQNYPWKLDELELEVIHHHKALEEAVSINQEAQGLMEKSIQSTKNFHEEYFESKKTRDKMLANTRRDVDKAHKEVKGSDKPKIMRAGMAALNPMQEVINKEAEEAQQIQQKYELQRKKRVEYEGTASLLKNACKVSSKEEILPAITQQHEVQRALRLQIDNLEDQKAVLEIERDGVNKEYKGLKYHGEKKMSEGMRMIEAESDAVESLKKKVKDAVEDIKRKEDLLYDVDLTCNNFFMLLQKYKIDPQARQLMTGQLDIDFAQLTEKLEQVCDQINTYGRVSDFLENPEFLDYMEDTLPKANTRVDIKAEEEEGADVFDDESATKAASNVMTREDIKKASQKIIEKNQGKTKRKKGK